eukprot:scaffold52011_cov57-Phaeocystis_antarctica.AAC.1
MSSSFCSRCCAVWTVRTAAFIDGFGRARGPAAIEPATAEPAAAGPASTGRGSVGDAAAGR